MASVEDPSDRPTKEDWMSLAPVNSITSHWRRVAGLIYGIAPFIPLVRLHVTGSELQLRWSEGTECIFGGSVFLNIVILGLF